MTNDPTIPTKAEIDDLAQWAEVDRTSILLVKVDTTEVLCDNSGNGGHLVGECR